MTFGDFKEKYLKKEVQEISSSVSKNPMVSVLVQTYQQKDFIRECLDSILIQETDFDFEILIGDDGSTDGTREICLEYAELHPEKVRVFLHHRENQIKVMGEFTSNFNAFYNFYSARGKYIAFCEGDDSWGDSQKLQKQVDFLEADKNFAFSYHEFKTIDEKGKGFTGILEKDQPKFDINKMELLEGKYHPLLLTMCFKREGLNIPEEIFGVLNIDNFLLVLFGDLGEAKYHTNIKSSLYRFRRDSMWSKKIRDKKLLAKIRTYQNLASFFERSHREKLKIYYLRKMKQHYKMLILWYLKNRNILLAGRTVVNYIRGNN